MKTGLESLDIGAPKITYSGNEGPQSPQQMAETDPLLLEEYEKYVFEMEEQGLQPMSLEEFAAQAKAGMSDGGRIGLRYGGDTMGGPNDRGNSSQSFGGGNSGGNGSTDRERAIQAAAQSYRAPSPSFKPTGGGSDPIPDSSGNVNQALVDIVNAEQRKTDFLNESIKQQEEKNMPEKKSFFDKLKTFVPPTRKVLYNITPNNPKTELRFLSRLKNFYPTVYNTLPQNLKDLYEETEQDLETRSFKDFDKFSFKDFEDLRNFNTGLDTPGLENFAEYAAKYAGAPGLKFSGDLANLEKIKNPDGTFSYIRKEGGEGLQQIAQAMRIPAISSAALNTTPINTAATTAATSNPFIPATNFNEYDVDQANKAYMLSLGVDPRMFAADGGRIGYAGGGIADLRQGYFLGKLVKKATRGIKKIAKSPIGKAALAFAAYKLGGGLFGKNKFFGTGFNPLKTMTKIGPMSSPFGKLLSKAGMADFVTGDLTKRGIFGGIAALSSLPLFMGQEEEDNLDEYTTSRRGDFNPFAEFGGVSGLRRNVLAGGLNRGDFAFMAPQFYAADGGLAENRMAALNQIYGINDDDEEQKLSMGGSAGLPPITQTTNTVDTKSFGDDETTGIAQATPQNQMPMPMPMRSPMMSPMMARSMNPMMMRSMNPMMARGMPMMGGRIMAQEGGIMMASDILGDESDDISMELYGKPVKDLSPGQLEDLREYLDSLRKDFASYGYDDAMGESFDEFLRLKKLNLIPEDLEFDEWLEMQDVERHIKLPSEPRTMAQEGGMIDMGGMEKDYRNEGGFVAIGGKERADDVPARLSKNEFVFTADAVRNAGGGDIDKGAEIMENMMENLEAGGKVSKASQGLEGARAMFATQQRLEEVL
jgi:hypothetical protein